MSQNSKFKLKYDELRAGDPTEPENRKESSSFEAETRVQHSGSVRNICFAWPNGRQKFFSYAYLISGELNLEHEMNSITLYFTSEVVTLKGYNLDELFMQLRNHALSLITQLDRRYAATRAENELVIEITVTSLK